MVLYTCKFAGNDLPGPINVHPCAKAVKALDQAGLTYEHRTVNGLRALPWTTKDSSRDQVRELTGQSLVPVLILDDGTVVQGSGTIAEWAKQQPAAPH